MIMIYNHYPSINTRYHYVFWFKGSKLAWRGLLEHIICLSPKTNYDPAICNPLSLGQKGASTCLKKDFSPLVIGLSINDGNPHLCLQLYQKHAFGSSSTSEEARVGIISLGVGIRSVWYIYEIPLCDNSIQMGLMLHCALRFLYISDNLRNSCSACITHQDHFLKNTQASLQNLVDTFLEYKKIVVKSQRVSTDSMSF